jgi:ubiquitin carboxyl-terminal hydrolase 25/28
MTQIEPSSEPHAHQPDPVANSQEPIKPVGAGSSTTKVEITPDDLEALNKGEGIPGPGLIPPLTNDEPNVHYRPPEAVPDSEPALGTSNDGWGNTIEHAAWADNQGSLGWGDQTNASAWENDWTNPPASSAQGWGPAVSDQTGWERLKVLGADEPWKDDSDKWWDKDLQRTKRKPGPGMLAPRAIEMMHDSDHILYEVSITGDPSAELLNAVSPKSSVTAAGVLNSSRPPTPATLVAATPTVTVPVAAPIATEATTQPVSDAPAVSPHISPTQEELRDATPHPSALFCRRHYGWVILSITTASATASHLGTHWCSDPEKKPIFDSLPNPELRKDKDCLETSPVRAPYETTNWATERKIHHFHRYQNVVAGSGLYPPLKRTTPTIPAPVETPINPSEDVEMGSESQPLETQVQDDPSFSASWELALPNEHLDLYMCCQCKTQILCSPDGGIIPCLIPSSVIKSYIQERASQPRPGQSKEQSVFSSLEMLLRLAAPL